MKTIAWLALTIASAGHAGQASAAVKTKEIEYRQGDTVLQGLLAWDDGATGKRPGVLVVHEWWGENEYAREQARRLAEAGYVGFAIDMYGKGKVATHPDDAQRFMQEATKDPKTVAARFDAALAALRRRPQVDPAHVAAIGYCFGGGVALAMARSGEDLDAVATFHAALPPPAVPSQGRPVKARVLLQTGGADPFVPKERVQAFEQEMKGAGADVQVITYPNAKHSFTVPDAGKAGMDALAYDPAAAKESWTAMLKFLEKVFRT